MSNTLDQLPTPQSRVEQYYDFLTGRSTDLTALPNPQSRIEEFLEFLCYNGSGNSGGGSSGLTQAQVSQLITQMLNGLNLKISDDESALELINSNQILGSVDLMTETQVQEIINQFI